MSRVLFIRPAKDTDAHLIPHAGLAMLSSVLKKSGHEVMVFDHLLFIGSKKPGLDDIIKDFSPDIIGISMYTATALESEDIINKIYAMTKTPIIVGGPHASIYADELKKNDKINYIVKGEAELTIKEVVENAAKTSKPVIVESQPPDVKKLPLPDFSSFLNWQKAKIYPLVTSRGCPFNCSFCVVKHISTKHWRGRDPINCVNEAQWAANFFPSLELLKVSDDCPTCDLERFKEFLRAYISGKINLPMTIDNMRADKADEELMRLARQANNNNICVAVEHGDSDVFNLINKGESLEDIKKSAEIIKKAGLELRLCFVIGLPGDTLKKTDASIKLAKELEPVHIYWNMAHPMKGTAMREYFEKNGAILGDDQHYTSYDIHSLEPREPVVETKDFTREERKKAYFKAVVETDQYPFIWKEMIFLAKYSLKYGYLRIAVLSLLRKARKLFPEKCRAAVKKVSTFFGGGK